MNVAVPSKLGAIVDGAVRPARVVVIVLMYGHAEQAIECISSVMASCHPDFRIILLDNASPDGALDSVRQWAASETAPCAVRDYGDVSPSTRLAGIASLPLLTLVQTGANLGYAGGNNVALKWLQETADWDYAWILNPDTAVEPGAMSALVARAAADGCLGVIGARICSYMDRAVIQQCGGGAYRPWRGTGRLIGFGAPADSPIDTRRVERSLDYVSGASMFFRRTFLARAGLMEERYFLYFEEVDWCRRRGPMRLGYAHDAVIYHRLGGSIGSATSYRLMSPLAIRWAFRNRIVFTRKFFPWALPTVYLSIALDIARMIRQGAFAQAWLAFKVACGIERVVPPARP